LGGILFGGKVFGMLLLLILWVMAEVDGGYDLYKFSDDLYKFSDDLGL